MCRLCRNTWESAVGCSVIVCHWGLASKWFRPNQAQHLVNLPADQQILPLNNILFINKRKKMLVLKVQKKVLGI